MEVLHQNIIQKKKIYNNNKNKKEKKNGKKEKLIDVMKAGKVTQ